MNQIELEAREAERTQAIASIEFALQAIESEKREPDDWEQLSLQYGIGALFRGLYRAAEVAGENALTPANERGGGPLESATKFSLGLLKEAFCVAQAEPLRHYPQFGPIVFSKAA